MQIKVNVKTVVLNSGGMDTFLMAHLCPTLAGATHLFVDVGQKYMAKELVAATASARSCGAKLETVTLQNLGVYEHASGIIPFRNAELILAAAQYGDDIYLAVLAGEINSDKSPEFFKAMQDVLNISHRPQYWTAGRHFNICTPVANFTKSQLVAAYLALGKPVMDLLNTVSCYSPTLKHCGACPSCFKRWVALVNNNIDHQCHFDHNPANWLSYEEWKVKLRDYNDDRRLEVAGALFREKGWVL